ncbi:MAG: DUF222 domain-containing protein, partial [Propionibacteriaceae bacterium]|nr:DUF222 domain-containing protein [Propionibacteriaceae bacterium]
MAAEAEKFALVLSFANLTQVLDHAGDRPVLDGSERLKQFGHAGTPRIAEFGVLDVAVALEISEDSAAALISDALDVCYRLPQIWQLVMSCKVRVWQARDLARITAPLSLEQAQAVDAELAETAAGMSPGRLQKLAQALTLQAREPDEIVAERADRLARRGVWFHDSESGVTPMSANLNAADGIFLNTQLERLAASWPPLATPTPCRTGVPRA